MTDPPPPLSRLSRTLVFAAALAVLVATLFPSLESGSAGLFECLICGDRGLADVILNVLLFLPLGAAIALVGVRMRGALLACAILSASVEVAQFFIPGRDASLGDLLFNSVGAVLGFLVTRSAPLWRDPSPRIAARLSLVAATVVSGVWLATGWLLQPDIPDHTAFPIWRPDLAQYEQWNGRVIDVTLDGDSLPDREPVAGSWLRARLTSGATIHISAAGGVPRPLLTPMLAIFDTERQELLVTGPLREDLGVRYRVRAARYRLDRPTIRGRGLMARQAPEERLDVTVRLDRARACLGVNGPLECSYGHTLGSGRALLLSLPHLPGRVLPGLELLWMLALALPVGFWMRRRSESAAALLLLAAGLAIVPGVTGLRATPLTEIIGAVAGVLAGAGISRLARERPVSRPVAGRGARTAASSLRR